MSASDSDPPPSLVAARRVAFELASSGAEAVVLVGSHARGEAGPNSDVDLLAVGDDSYLPRLEVRNGLLVSVSMQPVSVIRREDLGLPAMVCEAVPGWRGAVVLEDPSGLADSLIEEAHSWTWEPLNERCDAWVAEEIAARAETVGKLAGSLRKGNRHTASVKRHSIATNLARALAVHHRILYGSENRMWSLVSDAMGEEWTKAQSTALGLDGEPFHETCRAAMELYLLAADEVHGLLEDRQRKVVELAVATAKSAFQADR